MMPLNPHLNSHQIYDWMRAQEQELIATRQTADVLTEELTRYKELRDSYGRSATFRFGQLEAIELLIDKMEWDSTVDVGETFRKIRNLARDRYGYGLQL